MASRSTTPATALGGEVPPELVAEQEREGLKGASPGQLAWRRLRRNRGAMASAVVFILLVLACAGAPLWANYVACLLYTSPSPRD